MPYGLPDRLAGLCAMLDVTGRGPHTARDVSSTALAASPPGVSALPMRRLLATLLRPRPTTTLTPDTVVLVGDTATTLVVEAIISAGMARHAAFGPRADKPGQHRASPAVIRTRSWADAETAASRTEGCVVVAQAGFLPSEFPPNDARTPAIQVIDADSLIAASV